MTTPNNEVASLLLKVGVDFEALSSFAEALPVIPELIAEVGQRIDSTQVGSPELFRQKGAALARAIVVGFQAEAAGLSFGNLSHTITQQVFGQLDERQLTDYVGRVQSLLNTLRVDIPQVATNLIDPGAGQALASIVGGAAQAKQAVGVLQEQLGQLRGELAALQGLTLPKTLVRRSTGGELEMAPRARQALQSVGVPLPVIENRGSLAETNRVYASILERQLAREMGARERQLSAGQVLAGALTGPARPAPTAASLGLSIQTPQQVALARAQRAAQDAEAQARARAYAEARAQYEPQLQELRNRALIRFSDPRGRMLNPFVTQNQGPLAFLNQPLDVLQAQQRFREARGYPRLSGPGNTIWGGQEEGNFPPVGQRRVIFRRPQDDPSLAEKDLGDGKKGRTLAYAMGDGRGGGLIVARNDLEQLSAKYPQMGTQAAILEHEAQHLQRRNMWRWFERKQNDPTASPREEARADAMSGRRGYPNVAGTPEWQAAYDQVHRRVSEGRAYRDARERERIAEQAARELREIQNVAGGIPGAPPLQRGGGAGQAPPPPSTPVPGPQPEDPNERALRAELQRLALRKAGLQGELAGLRPIPPYDDPARQMAFNLGRKGASLEDTLGGLRGLGLLNGNQVRQNAIKEDINRARIAGMLEAEAAVKRRALQGQVAEIQAREGEIRASLSSAATKRQLAARAGQATELPGSGRPFFVGPDGQPYQPGTGVVATGIGRGIPQIPGVEDLRRQRALGQAPPPPPPPPPPSSEIMRRFYGGVGVPPLPPGGGAPFFAGGGYPGGGGAGYPPPRRGAAGGGGFPPPPPYGRGPAAGGDGGGGFFGGFLGGVRQGFFGGEEGESSRFFGRTIGSAARFSVAYGAMYSALRLVTGAFAQGAQGAIQFEQALTDLNIATERTGRSNETFAFQLADLGAGRGISPGDSVGVGARAIGLFDVVGAPRARQEAVARQSLETASKLAFIAGAPIEPIQTQIAGISRSFGVEALDQERIADVASYLGRRTGRPAAELLQSLGQIGSLGESAGFSMEQVGAIIARLTSTTGQTPQAVSGFLSQVLSRADDPRLQERLRDVGVNTQGTTLAQQIEQLSALTEGGTVSAEQKNQIIQGFGRGRSGQALGIILEQFPDIQRLAEGSRNESAGLAQRDFEQAVNTVGGQLRTLATALQDLFTGLASTGVLDPLVALLSIFKQMVDAADFVVDAFNLIPRELRTAGVAVVEFLAIMALLSKYTSFGRGLAGVGLMQGPLAAGQRFRPTLDADGNRVNARGRTRAMVSALGASLFGGMLGGGLGNVEYGDLLDRDGNVISTAGEQRRNDRRRGQGLGIIPGGLSRLGGTAAGGLFGGGVLGGAAVLGIGAGIAAAFVGGVQAWLEGRAVERAIQKAGEAVNTAYTPEQYDAAERAIAEARAKAEEADDFKLLSKDSLTLGIPNIIDDIQSLFGGGTKAEKEELDAQQKALEEGRKRAEAIRETNDYSVFGDFTSTEGVAQGLAELSERGLTATQQINLLNGAFDALIAKSGENGAAGVILQGQGAAFADRISTATIEEAIKQRDRIVARDGALGGFAGPDTTAMGAWGNISQTIGGLSPINALAGGLGRMAGTDQPWWRLGDDFLKGAGSGALQGFQEINPFGDSDRETEEKNRKRAEEFGKRLSDPKLRDKLNQGVLDSLAQEGLDPSQGPVSLSDQDVEVIKAKQVEILERELGKDFEEMTKAEKEAFTSGIEDAVKIAVGDFNGVDINATNVRAYLTAVRQLAGRAGQETALTSGSDVEGAVDTRQYLQDSRSKITDEIASLTGEIESGDLSDEDRKKKEDDRKKLIDALGILDLDIAAALKSESQARIDEIRSIADLAKSRLLPGDVSGGLALDAQAIRDSLAQPNLDDKTRRQLEAELNRNAAAQTEESRATSAQRALNANDPRRRDQELRTQISNLRTQIAGMADGSQREALIGQLNDLLVQEEDYYIELAAQGRLNRANPRNQLAQLRAEADNIRARLAVETDPLARAQLVGQLQANAGADAEYMLQNRISVRNARAGNPNNALEQSQIAEQNAWEEYREALRTGDANRINNAVTAINQTSWGRFREQGNQMIARNAYNTVTDPGSGLQAARQELYASQIDIQNYEQGTTEWFEAAKRVRDAQIGVAAAYRKGVAQIRRRLGSDLTNPLEQARLDLQDVSEDLASARANGAGEDTIAQLELDQAQASNRVAETAFQQKMDLARRRNELGLMTDTAYLQFLEAERARLEAIQNKSFQEEQQLLDTMSAIDALKNQYEGMWNLGDIQLPTIYEVRNQAVGGAGGNVPTTSTVNITVNGGNTSEVMSVMAQYLGPAALQRTPTVTPTRM